MQVSPFPNYEMVELPAIPHQWNDVLMHLDVALDPIAVTLKSAAEFNTRINAKIVYFTELPGDDDWQRPADTWLLRTGDCEDHAILKYSVLRKSGVAEADLMLTIGNIVVGALTSPHACLLVRIGEWHVLDSVFNQLILPANYKTFSPIKALIGTHAYLFSRHFVINKVLG
jgi:predicted transglutaminase-like cysteine proteinase